MATHVIKKYANRKLYDLNDRRYVNKAIIDELISAGESVQIVDQVSGDDITAELLGAVENSSFPAPEPPPSFTYSEPSQGTSLLSLAGLLPLQLPLRMAQAVIWKAVSASTAIEEIVADSMSRIGLGSAAEVEALRRQVEQLQAELRESRGRC